MGGADLDAVDLAVSWAFELAAATAVVLADERYLERKRDELRFSRTWPPASRMAAIFFFGELAVFLHFARTRRSVLGVVLGLFAAGAVTLVGGAASYLADLILQG
jgi:hypothetical protein